MSEILERKTFNVNRYSFPVNIKYNTSVQACKIGYLHENNEFVLVAIAEGPGLFISKVPKNTHAGFEQLPTPDLHFTFSSAKTIENITVLEYGEQWKIVIVNSIGETAICENNKIPVLYPTPVSHSVSWAGAVQISPNDIASVHQLGKSLSVYDIETQQKTHNWSTVSYPASVCSFKPNCLISTEHNQVCVWDFRLPKPLFERFKVTSSWLYTSVFKNNQLLVAGASRSIDEIDVRRWNIQNHWSNCLKFDITTIRFSNVNPKVCFAVGIDSEIVCGPWQNPPQQSRKTNFRGDSRWTGISGNNQNDTLVGYNDSRNLFLFTDASYLCSTLDSLQEKKRAPKMRRVAQPNESNKKQKVEQ